MASRIGVLMQVDASGVAAVVCERECCENVASVERNFAWWSGKVEVENSVVDVDSNGNGRWSGEMASMEMDKSDFKHWW